MVKAKCVLAYSGGMDSTIAVVWLRENRNLDVVTLTINLGGGPEIEGVRERALQAGAVDALIWDARREFVEQYAFKGLRAGALYEDAYPLSTALGRPLMSLKLVEAARLHGAKAIAHGCTGKGNDQVRFDTAIKTLTSVGHPLEVVAPAREWNMTRDEEKRYAAKAGLDLREVGSDGRVYSIDRNIWGQAIEGEDLEDTWVPPPEDAFSWTSSPASATNQPEQIMIGFESGTPVALNGKPMGAVELVENLNQIAQKHAVGRIDHVENRLIGIKSREIYEAPAATVLFTALNALEGLTLSREQHRLKRQLAAVYADLVYDGLWFSELRANLDAFFDDLHRHTTGEVALDLFKGRVQVVRRRSSRSLYDYDLATYSASDTYDHSAATGFIDVHSLSARTQYRKQTMRDAD